MHFHCIKASQIAILHAGLFTCQSCTMISFQSFRCHLHKMKQNPSGAEAINRVNSVHTELNQTLNQTKTPPNFLAIRMIKIQFQQTDLILVPQPGITLEIAILCSSKTTPRTRSHSLHHMNHNRFRDISIYYPHLELEKYDNSYINMQLHQ